MESISLIQKTGKTEGGNEEKKGVPYQFLNQYMACVLQC